MASDAAKLEFSRNLARQASGEVSAKIRSDFASQQRDKAEAHEQFMHYVNNTASFASNGGPTVTLPSGYKYNYVTPQGGLTFKPTIRHCSRRRDRS